MRQSKIILAALCFLCLGVLSSCQDPDEHIPNNLWQKINTPYFGKPLDVKFVNANTGYILGVKATDDSIYNILIKTVDGGQTWQSIRYTDRKFLTDTSKGLMQSIYVSPFDPDIVFSGGGNLLRSVDGGQRWHKVDTVNRKGGGLMHFFDPVSGVSVGGASAAITMDSGYNWSQTFFQSSFAFINLLQFTSKQTGYFAGGFQWDGGAGGTLGKTTDGGNTWRTIEYPFDDIVAMSFVNDSIGYISMFTARGNIGIVYLGFKFIKTTNGGDSWQVIHEDPNDKYTYTNIYFKTEADGFAINPKGIFHTTDGCKTWRLEQKGFMNFMCFPEPNIGYVMDTDGSLYKRTF